MHGVLGSFTPIRGCYTMPMMTKEELCRLIPHSGEMCLLDSVEEWTATEILCTTQSHRKKENPLRTEGKLEALAGLEIAAQAMAAHVALAASAFIPSPSIGVLGALRNVELYVPFLDAVQGDLKVKATQILSQATGFIYSFILTGEAKVLLKGRASIFIQSDV